MSILSSDNLLNKSSSFLFCFAMVSSKDLIFFVEIYALIYIFYVFTKNAFLIAVNCTIIFKLIYYFIDCYILDRCFIK